MIPVRIALAGILTASDERRPAKGWAPVRCFDVLQAVIRRAIDNLTPKQRAELSAAVVRLETLYNQLENGNWSQRRPDFNNPVLRAAYLYKYVAFNAGVLAELFTRYADMVSPLFSQRHLKAICLGGGPGSELIGLYKYLTLERPEHFVHLSAILVDRCGHWASDWLTVTAEGIEEDGGWRITSAYAPPTDVCDPASLALIPTFQGARLYISLYFLSELLHDVEQASPFLRETFAQADRGSVFFFLDNNRPSHYEWVFPLLTDTGWTLAVRPSSSDKYVLSTDEEKQTLAAFQPLMGGHLPRVQGSIAWGFAAKS